MPWKTKEPMEIRIEFAMKALRTDNFRGLCAEYGISAKTGYKWYQRFLERGMDGMAEQSKGLFPSPFSCFASEPR